ncbi:MAG TPA: ABC transporter permease [Candidatus Limnocylindria bacterium]|nr:ABC transporter permease [Candidatus Limnocylindria bacterium]
MWAELWAAVAIARKELRVELRYPLNAANRVVQPIYQFLIPSLLLGATFAVGGHAVGFERSAGTADLAGYLFLGAFFTLLVAAAFWGVAYSFKVEMDAGTLEPAWLTPTRVTTFVAGRALAHFLMAVASGVLLVGIGALAFGADAAFAVAGALPALAVAAVGLLGVGYLVAAAVLRIREPNLLVDATDFLFAVASGVAFPILVLPDPLRWAALSLPTTHALDLMRVQALGTRPLLPEPLAWVALIGLSGAWLTVGRWAFERTDRALRRRGTLGGH